jgi:rubrerythrin
VKATELLDTLRRFHKDKLTLLGRHVATARHVSDYDFNNTYQYVIAREEMHVSWVADAVQDVSADLGQGEASIPLIDEVAEPQVTVSGKGAAAQAEIIRQDAASAQTFVDTWRPIVTSVTHARHRTMLNVILGETLEHKRFFDQAVAGRTDLLGRRADGAGTGGGVLPVRWIEQ